MQKVWSEGTVEVQYHWGVLMLGDGEADILLLVPEGQLPKQLKEVRDSKAMEDELLQLTRELDAMNTHNLELIEEVMTVVEETRKLKEALKSEQN